jgi:hypothetical protein
MKTRKPTTTTTTVTSTSAPPITGNLPWTGTALPSVVAYAGPDVLPGVVLYAGPMEPSPWQGPASPTEVVGTVTVTNPCNHTTELKRLEERMARLELLMVEIRDGLQVRKAVRGAMDELLKKLGEHGRGKKKR